MKRTPRVALFLALLLGFGLPLLGPADPAAAAAGPVWTWGRDSEEMLANGPGWNNRVAPGPALRGGVQLADVVALSADYRHTLALKSDGTVWAWGWDYHGQLGDGTVGAPDNDDTPDQVVGLTGVVAIAAGPTYSLALKADGTVWAWGLDGNGQLADGTAGNPDNVPTPRQIAGLADITQIDAGYVTNFAIRADGALFAWGNNPQGELGLGETSSIEARVRRVPGMTGVQAVAVGNAHTVAVGSYTPLPAFGDLGAIPPATADAIQQLARLGVIKGCDQGVSPPLYCPDDTTLRAQMAALIVRGMVWSGETPANPFTDQCGEYCVDDELWNAIGVLAAKDVARGYGDAPTCAPAAAPCYDPRTAVTRAQVISFVTRAMVTKGYWAFATTDSGAYANVPGPFVERQGHRVDVVTYTNYLGTIPEAGAPTGPFANYDAPATRAWFALVLWAAIRDR